MTLCFSARIKEISLFTFVLLSLFSCKKDTQSVGAEFVSRNQFDTKFDTTIVLNAYSVKMDSVITSKLTAYALGSLYDPFLGISKATLVTQVGLAGNGFSWEGATKLDSVVLQLRFRTATKTDGTALPDYYGNKDAVHTFKVYLLDEALSRDSSYYSTRNYKTNGIEMGSFTGKLNFTDSVTIKLGTEKVIIPPHIRISMNSTFNSLLFNGELNGAFLNDSKFKEAIKGLVIVDETNVSSGEGAITYLKLTSDVTALTAFYKDSMAADFPIFGGITGNEASYNYYEHMNVPNQLLQQSFMGQHRDTGFVQPLTGCKLRVELPNLFSALNNPKIVINGAEMIFTPMNGSFQSPFTLPESMSLLASDSLGKNTFLKDQIFESSLYYGGVLTNNQYKFNIVRHLQNLLDQNKMGYNYNYGLNLIIRADDPLTAQRAILDTRKNSGSFKLKLTYTLIK
ncbi:MAG: hypothetical protein CFE21_05600 [Bacteroidetes bacterium B1(2017)]|nr:MAG: hypothetical protein CFE21_05600 [Bacteroidetes bacterium B1(2017)]